MRHEIYIVTSYEGDQMKSEIIIVNRIAYRDAITAVLKDDGSNDIRRETKGEFMHYISIPVGVTVKRLL